MKEIQRFVEIDETDEIDETLILQGQQQHIQIHFFDEKVEIDEMVQILWLSIIRFELFEQSIVLDELDEVDESDVIDELIERRETIELFENWYFVVEKECQVKNKRLLMMSSLFLNYFVHSQFWIIIQLHLSSIWKNVRKETREKSWCSTMYHHARNEKKNWWIRIKSQKNLWPRMKDTCDSPWLMTLTCCCYELSNHRSCKKKKSESDYITTTCISMKPIHRKCALIRWQKSISRSDSLKWLSWIRALHIPSILQWLNESVGSCKPYLMTWWNRTALFVSCRTRENSKYILNHKQAEDIVSAFRK